MAPNGTAQYSFHEVPQTPENHNKLFFRNVSICHTFFGRLSVYNSRVLVCLVVVQSVKNVSSGYNAILTGNDQLWTFIGVCNV